MLFCLNNDTAYSFYLNVHDLFLLLGIFVPRLFEEKRGDLVCRFPSICPLVPLQVVGTLCMQLLLQFYSDSFETL